MLHFRAASSVGPPLLEISKVADDPAERLVYTVPEAGRLLGLGRNAAYAAAQRGDIPTLRIGRLLLVPKIPFHRMLECYRDRDADQEPRFKDVTVLESRGRGRGGAKS